MFLPPSWEGSFVEGLSPGRFKLPFLEAVHAGVAAVRMHAAPWKNEAPELSAGWRQLVQFLKKKGVLRDGPVNEPWFTDSPKLHAAAFMCDMRRTGTDGHKRLRGFGRGTSETYEEALSKGIGELLERYPLMNYKTKDFLRASPKTLRAQHIDFLDPASVAGFTEQQRKDFPDYMYKPDATFAWVKGKEITSGRTTLIPAQFVFWNYCKHQSPFEPVVRQSNTNGAAGGFSYEAAVVSAMHELLQRDAFFLHWLPKVAPRRVVVDSAKHKRLESLMKEVQSYQLDIHFLYLTVDHALPVYACALISREDNGRPKLSLGGGSGGGHEDAMFDALREAINVHRWIRLDEYREGPFTFDREGYTPFRGGAMKLQEQRLRWWGQSRMFADFEWFLSGKQVALSELEAAEPYTAQEPKAELARLLAHLRKKGGGYEVFVYAAKDPVLSAVGYHSVKVIIPALVPLYLDETFAPLAAERLALLKPSLPKKPKRVYADFYPWPHPFP